MIDMFEVNRFVQFYRDQYPEIKLHVSYDQRNDVVKWEFITYSTGKCVRWHGDCVSRITDNVITVIDESFQKFLSQDVVKWILWQSRLEEL